MNQTKQFEFIDLFCGIGGFRIALESLGAKCVFSSDIDNEARKTYKSNFQEEPEGDITKIDSYSIPKHDILCAGFPCQPFSISGKQLGFNDLRGTLFYDIARIVEYHQPKFLFLENVANFVGHNNGNTLNTVLQTLNNLNYNIYYAVLNASHFGIPQARKRVYFIGIRKDILMTTYVFPKPTFERVSLNDFLVDDKETRKLFIKRNDISLDCKKIKTIENKLSIFESSQLKPIRIGFVNKGGQGERIYHPNGHAITLSAYGGGIGAKTGLYFINNNIRKLHPEECKRLMGFPESFIINTNSNHAYRQFGNSVVVKMINLIFKKLLEEHFCQNQKRTLKLEMKSKDVSLQYLKNENYIMI